MKLSRLNVIPAKLNIRALARERVGAVLGMKLYTNAFYLMINSVISMLLGFVFWMVVTRFYEPAHVGLASAVIAALGLLASFSRLGFGFGLIRFLPGAGDRAPAMINSSLTVSGLVSLAASLIFLAGLSFWSPALLPIRQDAAFFASFLVFTLTYTLFTLIDEIFIAKRSTKPICLKNISAGVLKIPAAIAFITLGSFGIFISAGIAQLVMLTVAIIWLLRRAQPGYLPIPGIRKKVLSDIIPYSLGNYISDWLWAAPTLILPLMVVNVLGSEMNAYFFIAWAVAAILFAIPLAISFSLLAEGSHEENLLRPNALRSIKLSLILSFLVILLIFGIGSKLLLLFGSVYSENGTTLLWILALSAIPLSINHIYLSVVRVNRDMKMIIGVPAALACLTLGLSYILITRMGLIGAGIGWSVGQTIVAVAVLVLLIKRRSFNLSKEVLNE